MKKRIIRQIIAMTMMLCIMSGLGALSPNPNFDPNYRLPPGMLEMNDVLMDGDLSG